MNIAELEELRKKIVPDSGKLIKRVVKELINTNVLNETISPLMLTHKEFIDVAMVRIIKKIKEKLYELAKEKRLPVGDKIFEVKLDYLAAYILKYDLKHENITFKTVTKFIVDTIKKDPNSLNRFVSTVRRDVYNGKNGTFKYPQFFPFDKDRYSTPIPELKNLISHSIAINRQLKEKEQELNRTKSELENFKELLKQTEFGLEDMKEILSKLKPKYKGKDVELEGRISLLRIQYKYFNYMVGVLKEKIAEYTKIVSAFEKSLKAFKEKNSENLGKEEEIIEIISSNLSKHKVKI